jgi:hypothetical protein
MLQLWLNSAENCPCDTVQFEEFMLHCSYLERIYYTNEISAGWLYETSYST